MEPRTGSREHQSERVRRDPYFFQRRGALRRVTLVEKLADSASATDQRTAALLQTGR